LDVFGQLSFLGGNANNGAHYANGLTAMFIAAGQDVANISESHAGVTYSQLLDDGDYYWSITLTSLIVATYGGGTGLTTQRECLELIGCYGAGKVKKFAEICAAAVLAGETSLSSAILRGAGCRARGARSQSSVNRHEPHGQARPVGQPSTATGRRDPVRAQLRGRQLLAQGEERQRRPAAAAVQSVVSEATPLRPFLRLRDGDPDGSPLLVAFLQQRVGDSQSDRTPPVAC
jgi:Hydroxymethylglutaryl-coenzyme A reductase